MSKNPLKKLMVLSLAVAIMTLNAQAMSSLPHKKTRVTVATVHRDDDAGAANAEVAITNDDTARADGTPTLDRQNIQAQITRLNHCIRFAGPEEDVSTFERSLAILEEQLKTLNAYRCAQVAEQVAVAQYKQEARYQAIRNELASLIRDLEQAADSRKTIEAFFPIEVMRENAFQQAKLLPLVEHGNYIQRINELVKQWMDNVILAIQAKLDLLMDQVITAANPVKFGLIVTAIKQTANLVDTVTRNNPSLFHNTEQLRMIIQGRIADFINVINDRTLSYEQYETEQAVRDDMNYITQTLHRFDKEHGLQLGVEVVIDPHLHTIFEHILATRRAFAIKTAHAVDAAAAEEEVTCGICRDRLGTEGTITTLSCHPQHQYCTDCLHEWICSIHPAPPTCPLCHQKSIPQEIVTAAKISMKAPALYGEYCLHSVATDGDPLNLVPYLLRDFDNPNARKNHVNAPGHWNNTPLHYAARNGHLPIVQRLLAAEANATAPNQWGETPLSLATRQGHTAIRQELIAARDTMPTPTQFIETSLHVAVRDGHLARVQTLLAAGANTNMRNQWGNTPLHYAAYYGNKAIILALLAARDGQNILRTNVNAQDQFRWTPLHYAVYNRDLPVAQALLAARDDHDILRADVNVQDRLGWTPLHRAAELHRTAQESDLLMMQTLIDASGDVNTQTHDDRETPLLLAVHNGHFLLAQALLAAGANVNTQDKNGWTPLHNAARSGDLPTVQALIASDANVNAQEHDRKTPLYLAAENGHTAIALELITAGADKCIQDRLGYTPLHEAAENGHLSIVQMLLATPITGVVEALTIWGMTPLHFAALNGHLSVVQALLTAGAVVNVLDNDHRTPVILARAREHAEVAQLLEQAIDKHAQAKASIATDDGGTGAGASHA